jgi:thymidylate synthase
MRVIHGRNAHQILPTALRLLRLEGIPRSSRFGDVLQLPDVVTTVYRKPWERVVFWPQRDANPFFHLYESLWMLAGYNDLASLTRYVKSFSQFSDDGVTLRGAYGYRWRHFFSKDQLASIVGTLRENTSDRRCVLQMWDTDRDLGQMKKDLPCNLIATFQINTVNELELVVFCRSNDIVWGAYGANAVHFSFLHEFMAAAIGVPQGRYTQISVNWHGYLKTLEPVWSIEDTLANETLQADQIEPNPYDGRVQAVRMPQLSLTDLDRAVQTIIHEMAGLYSGEGKRITWPLFMQGDPFWSTVRCVLEAHFWHKEKGPEFALSFLTDVPVQDADWVVAAREWLSRRIK